MTAKMNVEEINKIYAEVDRFLLTTNQQSKRELLRQYKIALDRIRNELAYLYQKYGDDISNKTFRLDRLKDLNSQIVRSIAEFKITDATLIKNAIEKVYEESYYLTGYAFESGLGIKLGFGLLNKSVIEEAVKNDYSKIKWQTSSKKNIAKLIQQTRDEVTQGIIQGKGYKQTAQILADRLGMGASKALRIVKTESGRAQSEARLLALEKTQRAADLLGIKIKRRWMHSGNPRKPRQVHIHMDNQAADENNQFHFPSGPNKGKKTDGPRLSNIAEEDVNCGCTERVDVLGLEKAELADAKTLEKNTTFNEWKKSL